MASVFVSSSLFGVWGLFFFFSSFSFQRRGTDGEGAGYANAPRAALPAVTLATQSGQRGCGQLWSIPPTLQNPGRAPRFVQRDSPPHPSVRAEIGVLSPLSGANCSAETLPGRVSSQVPWLPRTEGMNTQQQLRTKSSR